MGFLSTVNKYKAKNEECGSPNVIYWHGTLEIVLDVKGKSQNTYVRVLSTTRANYP